MYPSSSSPDELHQPDTLFSINLKSRIHWTKMTVLLIIWDVIQSQMNLNIWNLIQSQMTLQIIPQLPTLTNQQITCHGYLVLYRTAVRQKMLLEVLWSLDQGRQLMNLAGSHTHPSPFLILKKLKRTRKSEALGKTKPQWILFLRIQSIIILT